MACCITKRTLTKFKNYATSGRVVVFDTETTGIGKWDEIIQIAAIEYVNGVQTGSFVKYLVPTCSIDPAAEAIHHISRKFLEEHGVPPTEALRDFFAFLGEDVLLVAHNMRFDWRMLTTECTKFGYPLPEDKITCCDTLGLARKLVPGLAHYRLSCLIPELGLDAVNSHDALDDSVACGALFFNLMERIS